MAQVHRRELLIGAAYLTLGLSEAHATIIVDDGSLSVKDLGSANGTFVRINGQAAVNAGDLLLVGEQILRVDPA